MKKTAVFLLVAAIMISSFAAVFADPAASTVSTREELTQSMKMSSDDIKKMVISTFPEAKDASYINSYSYSGSNSNTWNVDFQLSGSGGGTDHYSMTVDDSTGKITGFNFSSSTYYSNGGKVKYPVNYSREQAKEIARSFTGDILLKLKLDIGMGEITSQGNYTQSYFNTPFFYSFNVRILYKGIPVNYSDAYVSVSATTGKVANFSISSMPAGEFSNVNPSITPELAKEAFNAGVKPALVYSLKPQPPETVYEADSNQYILVYAQLNGFPYVDAQSGYLINPNESPWENTNSVPLGTPKPYMEPQKLDRPLSEGQAREMAEAMLEKAGVTEHDNMSIHSANYGKDQAARYYYFDGNYQADNVSGSFHAVVDCVYGVITSFGCYTYNDRPVPVSEGQNVEKTKVIGMDEARNIAVEKVKEVFPDEYTAYAMNTTPYMGYPGTIASFSFTRIVGDALLPLNSIYTAVDLTSGKVNSITMNNDVITGLPAQEGIMTQAKAEELFLARMGDLDLTYIYTNRYQDTEPGKFKLVYVSDEPVRAIDAKSGEVIELGSMNPETQAEDRSAIKGDPEENLLGILMDIGFLKLDGSNPGDAITRGRFVSMAAKTLGGQPGYISYEKIQVMKAAGEPLPPGYDLKAIPYKDIQQNDQFYNDICIAYSAGLLDDSDFFRPDEPIAREDAAKILIRLKGLDNIAKLKDTFVIPFTDIKEFADSGSINYAILAYRLGLLSADGGMFRPAGRLSIRDAAVVLYNTAVK